MFLRIFHAPSFAVLIVLTVSYFPVIPGVLFSVRSYIYVFAEPCAVDDGAEPERVCVLWTRGTDNVAAPREEAAWEMISTALIIRGIS